MHSAWIGEHHFSTLGVLSCPDLVLAQVAARTENIRLAPAVSVLPLHHPIRVAEQWATLDMLSGGRVDFAAGRGYDRREYGPLGADFDNNRARKGRSSGACGRAARRSRIRAATTASTTYRSRRFQCSGRFPAMSRRSRSRRSNWRRGSAAT